jgi:hypothetical protein
VPMVAIETAAREATLHKRVARGGGGAPRPREGRRT